MLKTYRVYEGKFCEASDAECSVELYLNPDDAEKRHLVDDLKLDDHTLASALDPDEPSRMEFEPEHLAIIVNRPRNYSAADQYVFKVSSMGLFLFRDKLVIVAQEDLQPLEGKHFHRIVTVQDLMLRLLYRTTQHYLEHLRIITGIADALEEKLMRAMENRHLINLFSLEKGMVYYHNAVHSNGVVIEKMKANAARIGFTPENVEYLDDLVIENSQCEKQAEVFSNIFASLMDARASIVNNNLSVLIKRLTIINVVFLPLNFFAGMGGMSEYSMMTSGIPWHFAYPAFAGAMVVIALITYTVVRRLSRESMPPRARLRRQRSRK
jgi:magnesium transporter